MTTKSATAHEFQHEAREVMTPEELADFLRIGRTMSYRLLSEGSIPSYRIGRVRRVHRDDVLDYLQRNRAC